VVLPGGGTSRQRLRQGPPCHRLLRQYARPPPCRRLAPRSGGSSPEGLVDPYRGVRLGGRWLDRDRAGGLRRSRRTSDGLGCGCGRGRARLADLHVAPAGLEDSFIHLGVIGSCAELLHVPMLPDFDRADAIGSYWGNPKTRTFAELLIDCEEDRTLRLCSWACSRRMTVRAVTGALGHRHPSPHGEPIIRSCKRRADLRSLRSAQPSPLLVEQSADRS